MKVFFDIITNHTADVIGYSRGRPARRTSSKDAEPYPTAAGDAVRRPRLRRHGRLPGPRPGNVVPLQPGARARARRTSRSPAWLNDLTLYHNRGNTTFTGEDSQYGDFFGLDDLFTEHPRWSTE